MMTNVLIPMLDKASVLGLKGDSPMMQLPFYFFVFSLPETTCVKLDGPVDEKYKAMDFAFEIPEIKRVEFTTPLTGYFLSNILEGMSRSAGDELTCTLDAD